MRRNWNAVLAICALAGFVFPVFGQSTLVSGNAAPHVPHPYTAKFQITSKQTLANGTTITRESTEIQVVDSEGRRLTALTTQATERISERSTVRVYDPVAKTSTGWSVPGKSARVLKLLPVRASGPMNLTCWSTGIPQGTTTAPGPFERPAGDTAVGIGGFAGGINAGDSQSRLSSSGTTRENLGTQTIQGVVATGTRITHTTPTGAAGNDGPLVSTREVWNATSLGLIVRLVTDDPRNGKRTKELVELNQSEPELATFQPPEGYQIVIEPEMHEVPCAQ
jgi:hypothetical protein